MVKFRRSIKGDRSDIKPQHISIPQKDAIAIVPPKKVIKALYDHHALEDSPNVTYLSFSAGDFLHVVGRENDTDWYEACNPLIGSRGLVPVAYFDTVGKQAVRDTDSLPTPALQPAAHDSGYAEASGMAATPTAPDTEARPVRLSRLGRTGAMVYGVVMYDFKAERPDELEAREGEAIIVIAQSNPEWFVAKPITRLGGPGLIPVSFIEIRDMSTGQPVPNPQDAVQRAGVPRVEEWKKMAAEYKNGSIPLGQLEPNTLQLQQDMERLNADNSGQARPVDANGYGTVGVNGNTGQYARSHNSRGSIQHLLVPVQASVPRYCFADDNFWYIINAVMEDGGRWELSRYYKDFYDLQINLIQEFPMESGNVKGYERSLPYMPGPVTYVTDSISSGRRANLDEYVKNLLKLGPHIASGYLVRRFFAPRESDRQVEQEQQSTNPYRLSAASGHSTEHSQGAVSSQSSTANLHQRQQGHYRSPSDLGMGSNRTAPGLRQNNSFSQGGGSGAAGAAGAALKIKVWFEEDNCIVLRMPSQFSFADLYKKLRERRRLERGLEEQDDSAANSIAASSVADGESDDELLLEYRDDEDSNFYRIENDQDLQVALERCPKLTLMVSPRTKR